MIFFVFIYITTATNSSIRCRDKKQQEIQKCTCLTCPNTLVCFLNQGECVKATHYIPSACNRFFNSCCMSCPPSSSMCFSSSDLRGFEWYFSAVLLLHPVISDERLNNDVFHFFAIGSLLFPSLLFNLEISMLSLRGKLWLPLWNAHDYILLRQCYFSVLVILQLPWWLLLDFRWFWRDDSVKHIKPPLLGHVKNHVDLSV